MSDHMARHEGGREGQGHGGAEGPRASLGEFVRLIRDSKPSLPILVIALLLGAGSAIGGLLVPLFTKGIVDGFSLSAVSAGRVLLICAAFLVQAGAGALSGYLLARVGQGVVASLRERLWRKQLSLPITRFDEEGSGALVSRMTNDTAVVKGFITDNLTGFVGGAISIIGAIGFLLYLNWRMTLIILAALPVAALALIPLGRIMMRVARQTMDENARFTGILARVLSEIRLVKASNAEGREFLEGKTAIGQLRSFGIREGAVSAMIGPIMSLVMMSLLVLIIGYGGAQVASGALTAGDLVAFILYLIQFIMPVTMITQAVTQLQKARGATESIMRLLEAPEEAIAAGRTLAGFDEPIRFRNLGFGYKRGEPVLKELSFELEPGSLTAIVGPSGSGKTTIFSLLERFYEPQEGGIFLGTTAIGAYSLESWRGGIGYVSQDSPLMAGSVRDNLSYGVASPLGMDEGRLREAARMAYADEFIEKLPQGYDTEVGERGVKLSGGQRQRIAIARALLRDPALLMLDEATSSLDSASEEWVQRALENLMKGRTTLVIAHRLSTVLDADSILFLEGGRLTGRGSHAELVESHELYRSFAARQLRLPAAAAR
jgi:ATP-binding cassette, subfamily B, bacterial AbcA/BmrA